MAFKQTLQDVHLNVPLGQGFGTEAPAEQKKPDGHGNPPGLSSGEGSEAPPTQTNPAEQGPLGKVLPLIKKHLNIDFFSYLFEKCLISNH